MGIDPLAYVERLPELFGVVGAVRTWSDVLFLYPPQIVVTICILSFGRLERREFARLLNRIV